MQADEYQRSASNTNLVPGHTLYHVLGLISEIGEVAEYFNADEHPDIQNVLRAMVTLGKAAAEKKRDIRDRNRDVIYTINVPKQRIISEVGDCLWYVSQILSSENVALNSCMKYNLQKLAVRKENGTLQGEGNDR